MAAAGSHRYSPRSAIRGLHWIAAVPVAVAFHAGLLWIIHNEQHELPTVSELAVVLAPASSSVVSDTAESRPDTLTDTPVTEEALTSAPDEVHDSPVPAKPGNLQEPVIDNDAPVEQVSDTAIAAPTDLPTAIAHVPAPPVPAVSPQTREVPSTPAIPDAQPLATTRALVEQVSTEPSEPDESQSAPAAEAPPTPEPQPSAIATSDEEITAVAVESFDELDDVDELDNAEAIDLPRQDSVADAMPAGTASDLKTDETEESAPADVVANETAPRHMTGVTINTVASALTARVHGHLQDATAVAETPAPDAQTLADIKRPLSPPTETVVMRTEPDPTEPVRVASAAPGIDVSTIRASHEAQILALINANKRYPIRARQRGDEGIAKVNFTIDRDGEVVDSALVTSSGHRTLDRESLALIKRVPGFPPIPRELSLQRLSVTVPVQFSL